jgi:hypothetical protein
MTLTQSGIVEDAICFGPGPEEKLSFAILISTDSVLKAGLYRGRITISVPESEARVWADTSAVSIDGKCDVGHGEVLSVLVEKDFACLTPRDSSDDADTFPHPKAKGN